MSIVVPAIVSEERLTPPPPPSRLGRSGRFGAWWDLSVTLQTSLAVVATGAVVAGVAFLSRRLFRSEAVRSRSWLIYVALLVMVLALAAILSLTVGSILW